MQASSLLHGSNPPPGATTAARSSPTCCGAAGQGWPTRSGHPVLTTPRGLPQQFSLLRWGRTATASEPGSGPTAINRSIALHSHPFTRGDLRMQGKRRHGEVRFPSRPCAGFGARHRAAWPPYQGPEPAGLRVSRLLWLLLPAPLLPSPVFPLSRHRPGLCVLRPGLPPAAGHGAPAP